MNTVVITGGTGFIGFWLTKEMIDNGINVILLVRNKNKISRFESSNVRVIEYYSDEYNNLKNEQSEIDAFYHLAWSGAAPEQKMTELFRFGILIWRWKCWNMQHQFRLSGLLQQERLQSMRFVMM